MREKKRRDHTLYKCKQQVVCMFSLTVSHDLDVSKNMRCEKGKKNKKTRIIESAKIRSDQMSKKVCINIPICCKQQSRPKKKLVKDRELKGFGVCLFRENNT